MSPADEKPLQIKVPREAESGLRLIAKAAGFVRGGIGNISPALVALAKGDFYITRSLHPATEVNYQVRAKIGEMIDNQRSFSLTYQGNDIQTVNVTCAEIVFDAYGRNYLVVYTDKENPLEIVCLSTNFTIDINDIIDVTAIKKPWNVILPQVEVCFWILNKSYISRKNDQVTSKKLEGVSGLLITRKIISSELFISEVLGHGSNCCVIKPDNIRQEIASQLRKSLSHYSSATP